MSTKVVLKFIFVNLGFLFLTMYMLVITEIVKVKQNWPLYRCNPSYMFLANNVSKNFEYCLAQRSKKTFSDFSGDLQKKQKENSDSNNKLSLAMNSFLNSYSTNNGGLNGAISDILGKSGGFTTIFSLFFLLFKSIFENLLGVVGGMSGFLSSSTHGVGSYQDAANGK